MVQKSIVFRDVGATYPHPNKPLVLELYPKHPLPLASLVKLPKNVASPVVAMFMNDVLSV